jgi:hypothetical protein
MNFVQELRRALEHRLQQLWDRYGPARQIRPIQDDALPESLPWRDFVLCHDDGEPWSVGMRCPCGCGGVIELLLASGTKPRWDLQIDIKNRPTLSPSVWRKTGCEAHFWVRHGRIKWCKPG